jgi:hypothetical protein
LLLFLFRALHFVADTLVVHLSASEEGVAFLWNETISGFAAEVHSEEDLDPSGKNILVGGSFRASWSFDAFYRSLVTRKLVNSEEVKK